MFADINEIEEIKIPLTVDYCYNRNFASRIKTETDKWKSSVLKTGTFEASVFWARKVFKINIKTMIEFGFRTTMHEES